MDTNMFWLRRFFPDCPAVNFLRYKFLFAVLSIGLTLATFVLGYVRPLNLGIDFTGGLLFEVRLPNKAELGEMRKAVHQLGIGDVLIQSVGDAQNDVMIKVGLKDESRQKEYVDLIKSTVVGKVSSDAEFRKFEYIGAEVGNETIKKAVLALLLTFVGIQFYIWYRFSFWYSIGVVVGLLHDLILTVAFLMITQTEFNASSIAALLAVLGYSVNDTVVIYDRVRENAKKFASARSMTFDDILNRSVNETLARTIFTVSTTLLAAGALIIFGGESLYAFSLTVFVGIAIGTYSSVCVSVPFLSFFMQDRGGRLSGGGSSAASSSKRVSANDNG